MRWGSLPGSSRTAWLRTGRSTKGAEPSWATHPDTATTASSPAEPGSPTPDSGAGYASSRGRGRLPVFPLRRRAGASRCGYDVQRADGVQQQRYLSPRYSAPRTSARPGGASTSTSGWPSRVSSFRIGPPPLMGYIGSRMQLCGHRCVGPLGRPVDVDTDRITLYRNGTVADQETRPSDIVPGDATLYFGRWNMDGRFLNGDLDDIAIWQRALTPEEIRPCLTPATLLRAAPTRFIGSSPEGSRPPSPSSRSAEDFSAPVIRRV